ncbi:MAG: MFS transporter [Chloroflexi bacterium]|nr:MFS transporter [Chloroflexota bacterium]
MVLAIAAVTVTFAYGIRMSFAVFYGAILDEFGWSRAETALAFSLNLLVYGLSSPLVGALVDRFGPRRVIPLGAVVLGLGLVLSSRMNSLWEFNLFYGLLTAFGINALGFVPHNAFLQNWFFKRRGLALGLMAAGAGVGFVMAAVAQFLIQTVGWRGAYLALGLAAVAVVVPLVAFFQRTRPQDVGQLPDGLDAVPATGQPQAAAGPGRAPGLVVVDQKWADTEWTLAKALRTRRLWALFFMFFLMSLQGNMVGAHAVRFWVDVGFTPIFAALIFSLFGLTQVVGNLGGTIVDRIGREPAFTLGTAFVVLSLALLPSLQDPSQVWILYAFATTGLMAGLGGPATFAACADIFQGKHYGSIYGFITLGFGLGGFLGPWLAGFIFDQTGSYSLAFIIATVVAALSGVAMWLAAPRQIRRPGVRALGLRPEASSPP